MLAALLAALCFALSAIFARRSTRLVGSIVANYARLLVAGTLLAAWAYVFGSGVRGPGFRMFVLSGMVGFGVGDLGMFAALPLLGSRLTALMVQCLAAPLAALIEWLWLGTRLNPLELSCGTAILIGVAVAIAPEKLVQTDVNEPLGQPSRERMRGTLCGGIAALGQAGGAVISRKAFAISEAGGVVVDGGTAAYQRALGGLVVLTIAFLFSRRVSGAARAQRPQWKLAWPWIIANSLAGAAIGVSFYQWALATTPSAVVLPIVALTPLIVVPFAYLFERERPSARSLWGGLIAVAAAALLAHAR